MIKSLLYITRLNWLEDFYPGYHREIVTDIQENIEICVKSIKYRLKTVKLIFQSMKILELLGSLYKDLQSSSQLAKIVPNITSEIND